MAQILFHENTGTFHLFNDQISYIMTVLKNGNMGQLYFGKRIRDKEDFSYLMEDAARCMASCVYEGSKRFSLEHIKQEYPVYGTSDYREPAIEVVQKNGSRISDFQYQGYEIVKGKPALKGLPATYAEAEDEAVTLKLWVKDSLTGVTLELLYTIFEGRAALARSVKVRNEGEDAVYLTRVMSLCMDLPDFEYEWVQLSGAWARERHVRTRKLEYGIQSVDSKRGHSSHEQNPFVVLKRPHTTEKAGEAIGFSLVYSGNFLAQAEVDTHDTLRMLLGINPFGFEWKLEAGDEFQSPEAVMVYTDAGLNDMSHTFHRLYRSRLARGYWRDKERPILINNWEATYFDFDADKLVEIAKTAKECGVELFVLDDGWFGNRYDDTAGLGDWVANEERLPGGIAAISERIEALGMKFGLWFEPEMANKDSRLYREHPDYLIHTPGRRDSHGRYQYVLDFSRKEVVDYIYGMMAKILRDAKVSYVKWDMNRSITECYSGSLPADRQGEVFHRYILGVYDLYERLTGEFPEILFESCASGGARFDPGMLYYAPQAWTSDDTDAAERLKIQYGTSLCYPISSMGSHVSMTPNHQLLRNTPLHTRANVAYFGTFGYELDLNRLTEEEREEVKGQVAFMKKYRRLLQFGTFYRLSNPFEKNVTAWMVVSEDRRTALVGYYRVLNQVNAPYSRLQLQGLSPELCYVNEEDHTEHYGDELMNLGLITSDDTVGQFPAEEMKSTDFESRIYVLKAK